MNLKKLLKISICGAVTMALLTGTAMSVNAAEKLQLPSYKTVTEVFDWGPSVSKVIVNLGHRVKAADVDKTTFKVYVRRVLAEGAMTVAEALNKSNNITLGSEAKSDKDLQGERQITNIYVSDANGNAVNSGDYVTIEMFVSPTDTLGAALNFDLNGRYNNWVTPEYTITQVKNIGKLKNLVIDNNKGNIRPIVDQFTFSHKLLENNMSYPYASFEPADGGKHPLIVWLHGMGEGGNSPSLPIMGNKADMFADESLQKHFGGAYVLVPQARTYWMHGYKDFADGTSIYTETLMELIKSYAADHNVDTSRVYIGGDSNGGYMTMLMVRDYPDYFAAAFPTCEGLADKLINETDLRNIAKTPLWFIAAKTDIVLPPKDYVVPTVDRLRKIGANVHFTFFDDVHDTSGLYKKDDGSAYEYPGHWSWIYVYNDEVEEIINGKTVKLMDWLAQQKR